MDYYTITLEAPDGTLHRKYVVGIAKGFHPSRRASVAKETLRNTADVNLDDYYVTITPTELIVSKEDRVVLGI